MRFHTLIQEIKQCSLGSRLYPSQISPYQPLKTGSPVNATQAKRIVKALLSLKKDLRQTGMYKQTLPQSWQVKALIEQNLSALSYQHTWNDTLLHTLNVLENSLQRSLDTPPQTHLLGDEQDLLHFVQYAHLHLGLIAKPLPMPQKEPH